MTRVAHSVVATDADDHVGPLILSKVFVSSHRVEQSFDQVVGLGFETGKYDAGGSVFFVDAVYAAAFNHVAEVEIADWFESLPWRDWDNASLTIFGEIYTLFVLVVDGKSARTVSSV